MNPILKKMNFKGEGNMIVINAPDSFTSNLTAVTVEIYNTLEEGIATNFVLSFVQTLAQIERQMPLIEKALQGDGALWFAYPKGTSKRYKCEFNRDNGWETVGAYGFEPVRMIAIDEDWSALRFRRVAYIKKMTRSFAMTAEGKAKVDATTKQNTNN